MTTDRKAPDSQGPLSDTSRAASRGAIYWMAPIALLALDIVLVAIHFIGHVK